MPAVLPVQDIRRAEAAVVFARQVRNHHRRRTDRRSEQRRSDIQTALARIREAMAPLRSQIGRFPYGPQTDAAEANREIIRDWSDQLQRERRKLWKMR